ncbi:hypothetical protein [Seohaeicola zhoushanensis]|uniref:Uncharacterized protein n=1 Tax=Seohaeicola zhoushanensis TaxID=1569283 RepID=A0A8J3M9I3_9RHOB|nr:hypothetical protein [Seohaeicola zhoushanensis]GHF59369.1 hypothetical protein GCM10017056_33680 [Seohaeicola zhoushanensis]
MRRENSARVVNDGLTSRKKAKRQSRLFITAVVVCAAAIAGAGAVHSHHAPAPETPAAQMEH